MTNDLAALSAAATQGEWRTQDLDQGVQIWAGTYVGGTRDYYGDDAAFIVALVNAYRTGNLVQIDREGMRERVVRSLYFDHVDQHGYPNGLPTWDELPDAWTRSMGRGKDSWWSLADAAIAAILGGE